MGIRSPHVSSLYAYSNNNPMTYIDPDGMAPRIKSAMQLHNILFDSSGHKKKDVRQSIEYSKVPRRGKTEFLFRRYDNDAKCREDAWDFLYSIGIARPVGRTMFGGKADAAVLQGKQQQTSNYEIFLLQSPQGQTKWFLSVFDRRGGLYRLIVLEPGMVIKFASSRIQSGGRYQLHMPHHLVWLGGREGLYADGLKGSIVKRWSTRSSAYRWLGAVYKPDYR